MLSGIKRQGVVGKNGKIEIQATELAEGTVVKVIALTEQSAPQHQRLHSRQLQKTPQSTYYPQKPTAVT